MHRVPLDTDSKAVAGYPSRRGFCFSPGRELPSFLTQMSRSQCPQVHSNRFLVLSQALGSVALPGPRCAALAPLGFLQVPPSTPGLSSLHGKGLLTEVRARALTRRHCTV